VKWSTCETEDSEELGEELDWVVLESPLLKLPIMNKTNTTINPICHFFSGLRLELAFSGVVMYST
jgi:hypothetical protein